MFVVYISKAFLWAFFFPVVVVDHDKESFSVCC